MADPIVPKTPAKFDYDLWTTEDGKCMVRVKRTGEVSEVEREVFRLLRSEEKRMRREINDTPASGDGKACQYTVFSSSYVAYQDAGGIEAASLVDPLDLEADFAAKEIESELRRSLTEKQLAVLDNCLLAGMGIREYARNAGIDHKAICHFVKAIQKKLKKILDG